MAAALLSVVSSLPPSEDAPDPDSLAAKEAQAAMEKIATAKVKAWRKAGKKEKEEEPMKAYPMFGTTWGEGFEAPYGEISATTSNDSSEWDEDWISRGPTPSLPSRPDHLLLVGCAPSPCAWKELYLHVWLPLNSAWMRPWNSFPGFWGLGMKILI